MKHPLEHFLREAERCVPHLTSEERRKWAEECHAQHPGITGECKTGAAAVADARGSEPLPGGRGSVGGNRDLEEVERAGGSVAWKRAGLALLLLCAARQVRCQDPAGFNGGLDPAFRNVPLLWVVNAPNGACSGVTIQYAFNASPPALYGCNQGTWTDLTAGGGGGGSGTVTSVATNNGLTGGTITVSGTLGLASIAAGGMLCNSGTSSAPPTVANCGISVPESVTGTVAVSASSPLSLNATTGNLTCPGCLTANQTIAISGDASGSGTTSIAVTNTAINGGAIGASWNLVSTNSSSRLVSGTYSNVVALFSGCSGTQYLGADGGCHNSGGGGTPCTTTNNSLQFDNGGSFGCATEFTYGSSTITLSSAGVINMSAATSLTALQVPTSGGYAPTANGALGFDSTQERWAAGGNQNTTGYFPRVLYTSNATNTSGNQLVCSTIGTTETAFASSYNVPAGFIIENKSLRITAAFDINTPASESSMQFRLRWGGVSGTAIWTGASTSEASAAIKGEFVEWMLQGTAAAGSPASIEAGGGETRGTYTFFDGNSIQSPVSVNTSSSEAFVITLTCGAATTSQNATLRQMVVEELN